MMHQNLFSSYTPSSFVLLKILYFWRSSELLQLKHIMTRACQQAPKKTKKCHKVLNILTLAYGLGITWGWRQNWRWIIPLINCSRSTSWINRKSLNWRAEQHICLCFIFMALKAPCLHFMPSGEMEHENISQSEVNFSKEKMPVWSVFQQCFIFDDIQFAVWACIASIIKTHVLAVQEEFSLSVWMSQCLSWL